jgi:hypothetical protein
VKRIAVIWGLGGVLFLLGNAIFRLTPRALDPVRTGMPAWQWALYAASIAFNAYAEGYRAFQLQFAPRSVARLVHLVRNPRPLHVALAPFFVMALFHASRRRLIVSWCVLVGVLVLVIVVNRVDQPWRGIVDAGVVVGLGWGTLCLIVLAIQAAAGRMPRTSPDLPD